MLSRSKRFMKNFELTLKNINNKKGYQIISRNKRETLHQKLLKYRNSPIYINSYYGRKHSRDSNSNSQGRKSTFFAQKYSAHVPREKSSIYSFQKNKYQLENTNQPFQYDEISDMNENQIPTTLEDIIQGLPSYNTKQRLQKLSKKENKNLTKLKLKLDKGHPMVAIHRESLTERKLKLLDIKAHGPFFGWGVYKDSDGYQLEYEEVESRLQAQNESENDKSISIIQQAEEMERQQKIEKQKWAVHWFGIIIKRMKQSQIDKKRQARQIMMNNLLQKRNMKFNIVKSKKKDFYDIVKQ